MSDIFTKRFPVPPEAIDAQRHVNNLAYLQWMQDVAIEHSAALGWPMERYVRTGGGWVVRTHFIEYLRPAFEAEPIALHTWISEAGNRRAVRHYVVVRDANVQELRASRARLVPSRSARRRSNVGVDDKALRKPVRRARGAGLSEAVRDPRKCKDPRIERGSIPNSGALSAC